jgi:hypothetical protein
MSFSINFNPTKKIINKLANANKKIVDTVLYQTASAIKLATDEEEPKAPLLEGNLRGTARVDVNNNTAKIWYTMPYAARWHEVEEGTVNWSESGVGPKYLEKKIVQTDRWGSLMADIATVIIEESINA